MDGNPKEVARNITVKALKGERNSNLTTSKQKSADAFLEQKWDELTDIPFDADNSLSDLVLAEDWWGFKKGTSREDIWRFFDRAHSKGVAFLLNARAEIEK